jgi:hypothetical protein
MLSVRTMAIWLSAIAAAAWAQVSRVASYSSHQPSRIVGRDNIHEVVVAGDVVGVMDQINLENVGSFGTLTVEIGQMIRHQ